MIKFLVDGKNGVKLIGLGLSEGNIKRLKAGDSVYIHLDELGFEGLDLTIIYGKTEKSIVDVLNAQGLIPLEGKG